MSQFRVFDLFPNGSPLNDCLYKFKKVVGFLLSENETRTRKDRANGFPNGLTQKQYTFRHGVRGFEDEHK